MSSFLSYLFLSHFVSFVVILIVLYWNLHIEDKVNKVVVVVILSLLRPSPLSLKSLITLKPYKLWPPNLATFTKIIWEYIILTFNNNLLLIRRKYLYEYIQMRQIRLRQHYCYHGNQVFVAMFPKFAFFLKIGFHSIFIDRIIILHLNKYYFIKFQKHYPDLGSDAWRVISMEFLRSFRRRHLAVKPVVASPNVGCFLRLQLLMKSMSWVNMTKWQMLSLILNSVHFSRNCVFADVFAS